MKFSMTGQEKMTFKWRWLLNKGDCMGRYDCIYMEINFADYKFKGPSWLWLHGSWIYNYLCNQSLSPLMLWDRISIRVRCTTLCDKVCQWLAAGRWFSLGPHVLFVTPTTMLLYGNNNRTRLLIQPVVEVLLLFLLVFPPVYRHLLIEWLVFNANFSNISAISWCT